jgi:hypothetical protein
VKTVWFLFASSIVLSGCTHIRYLTPDTPTDTVRVINQRIAPFHGYVTKRNGEYYYGKHIQIGDSLTLWKNTRGNRDFSLPNERIQHIIAQDRKLGFVEGSEYGALWGAILGVVIGSAAYLLTPDRVYSNPVYDAKTWPPGGCTRYSHDSEKAPLWEYWAWGALGGGALGTGVGMLLGYGGGSKIEIRYVFPPRTK